MLLYSYSVTNRLSYIVEVLFKAIGVEEYEITTDLQFYESFPGAKVNYSAAQITVREVWITPARLLNEQDIKPQNIEVFLWNGYPAFYKTSGEEFPFDLFAASFYLLTRYEEYLPHSLDSYGRFAHENSFAFLNNILQIPLVNIWLKAFSQLLKQLFPALNLKPASFYFKPTYDIDIAWSYLNKNWFRNIGGLVRSISKAQFRTAAERLEVLTGKRKDPYDSYEWLDNLHSSINAKPTYFFLAAQKTGAYDKNISPADPSLQQLIKRHAINYEIGAHPSWQSGTNYHLIKQEIEYLQKLSGHSIFKSRQHYIRITLPETYRQLIAAGITEDYSMGYGSINGFRASYCLPYNWYDLQKEAVTSLVVYPFCYMDANSFFEQHLSAAEAFDELEYYYEVTKKVNGVLITVWHNHILGTDKMFEGWKEVYSKFLLKYFLKS